jgi:hypothetical protein
MTALLLGSALMRLTLHFTGPLPCSELAAAAARLVGVPASAGLSPLAADQPRVPAGSPEGGQFAAAGSAHRSFLNPTEDAPPEIEIPLAKQLLAEGLVVQDDEGVPVKFGKRVADYFERSGNEKENRFRYLLWAKEAVAKGVKLDGDDRVEYLYSFRKNDGKPGGIIVVSAHPDGEVFNFFREKPRRLDAKTARGGP